MPRVSSLLAPGFYIWRHRKWMLLLLALVVLSMFIALAIGKAYQNWDDDPDRGAIGIENGAFGESYATPIYLNQGWSASDSLWFYTTTQGSNLLPYDFFLVLEQAESEELFRSDANIDYFRYLPQKPTFFNPDGMPVGFAKDTYEGRDYMGFTCAACHTGQVNYRGTAIRIDGGPAMADMVGFLTALAQAMEATLSEADKRQRFVERVIALDNDFQTEAEIIDSLTVWRQRIGLYNTINHSHVDYGYARLDAFGRIYNRVLQHILNHAQLAETLAMVMGPQGAPLLSATQIQAVLQGVNASILSEEEFAEVVARLQSNDNGLPGLGRRDMLRIRDALFNEPDAPVSYPFLWDIVQSDYVQWNGLANNAGVGPLGRNTGEVIGVFGNLDWSAQKPGFNFSSLSAWITGQSRKHEQINFKSSIDLVNLERLEAHLKSLTSPAWPESIFGSIDLEKAQQGRLIYARYCESCHEVIQPRNWDRVVIGKMMALDKIGTDPAMAQNSVHYTGKSGNFNQTVQETDVGKLYIAEEAPVVQILTSATRGVVATPDADKWLVRRWLDWLYTLGMSFFQNEIQATIKNGNYTPDTTAQPYNSLLSYKARPLNGIWATAPYLHNGSVPTLYDLLLPKKRVCSPDAANCIPDPEIGQYRPDVFYVGQREFDPVKVGNLSQATDAKRFITTRVGDLNSGHEYGAGRTPQLDGKTVLPALDEQQRWQLIEYLKTL
ncbi:di-heme-cytochrome C peroxidase [Neptuniibacter sp. CAU 1671]|uniref:di-heme-cytochrome C peroxidase n=1 Tax=Neptuniibacter sp. CAU 1671 TaxID=3032593 RepID=UPI0023D9F8B3|nr:di-heme-cytochrome C peroxidase [Neptuniibacter sp. CAU 1671]MDF2180648.1 di-heme-cytochrome C peroxidase [Neptuniibacter sp. CAU 1671]